MSLEDVMWEACRENARRKEYERGRVDVLYADAAREWAGMQLDVEIAGARKLVTQYASEGKEPEMARSSAVLEGLARARQLVTGVGSTGCVHPVHEPVESVTPPARTQYQCTACGEIAP